VIKRIGARRGVSLMEVLISIFVMTFGLLGLAALIPVGRFAIEETGKADRCGACGRAAMREVKVRRMLGPDWDLPPNKRLVDWVGNPGSGGPFVIDPIGVDAGLGNSLGPLPRITLALRDALGNAIPLDSIFRWRDDLKFHRPEDGQRPHPAIGNSGFLLEPDGSPQDQGYYTWFLTVTPARGELGLEWAMKRNYAISVVVCFRRTLEPEPQANVTRFIGGGYGGGGVVLSGAVEVREGEWIMLCDAAECKWYRVVSVGQIPGANNTRLRLSGPDWDVNRNANPQAVIPRSVVGVYSTAVEVERNPLWGAM